MDSLAKFVLRSHSLEAIRYLLHLLPSMTAEQCCQILHCALFKEKNEVAKMLCEELYSPDDDPDMSFYGVQVCCEGGKGIDLVKSIINAEIVEQMNEEIYMRTIVEPCKEGRVDVLKYLEEEVRPIPHVERFVEQYANDEDHLEVLEYLVEVMNER